MDPLLQAVGLLGGGGPAPVVSDFCANMSCGAPLPAWGQISVPPSNALAAGSHRAVHQVCP